MRKLSDLKIGESASVLGLESQDLIRERMLALGITKGAKIEVIRKGPKDNLTVYIIRGVMVALRKEDSLLISVE